MRSPLYPHRLSSDWRGLLCLVFWFSLVLAIAYAMRVTVLSYLAIGVRLARLFKNASRPGS